MKGSVGGKHGRREPGSGNAGISRFPGTNKAGIERPPKSGWRTYVFRTTTGYLELPAASEAEAIRMAETRGLSRYDLVRKKRRRR